MKIRPFLARLAGANADNRVEIVHSLVRVFAEWSLSDEDRQDVVTSLFAVLDDPSIRVRRSLAEALAPLDDAPRALVRTLAEDHADIATPVLLFSPVLTETDLVDIAATGLEPHRVAIALRPFVPVGISAAIAEIGGPDSCEELLRNNDAQLTRSSLFRIADRHGGVFQIREALVRREDLPAAIRHRLVVRTGEALTALVTERGWVGLDRIARTVDDAQEQATATVGGRAADGELEDLVAGLHEDRLLTETLVLRALVLGHFEFAECALTALSKLPRRRVMQLTWDREVGRAALIRRLPFSLEGKAALDTTLAVLRGGVGQGDDISEVRMRLTCVERIITRCEARMDHGAAFLPLFFRLQSELSRLNARASGGDCYRAA